MKDRIDVIDGTGGVAFVICVPEGRVLSPHGWRGWEEKDPRYLTNTYGRKLLEPMWEAPGLDGVRFKYFRVDGGDVIRLVVLGHNDHLVRLFGGAAWWEVYETVEEAACSSSPVH